MSNTVNPVSSIPNQSVLPPKSVEKSESDKKSQNIF